MLARYLEPEDWWHVRFSDEVHFGLGPMGKLMIIRKLGERYCLGCIQEQREPDKPVAEAKKAHAWAAIGHDFKSDLIFYDVPTNTNGKMTAQFYVNNILEPVIKPWIQNHSHFILEEDRDSGHGIAKTSTPATKLVKTWKQENNLTSYFNYSGSPDLAPIENAWQPTKQYIRKFPHFTKLETIQLAREGWEGIKQDWINKKVDEIPDRLQAVIDHKGLATGY